MHKSHLVAVIMRQLESTAASLRCHSLLACTYRISGSTATRLRPHEATAVPQTGGQQLCKVSLGGQSSHPGSLLAREASVASILLHDWSEGPGAWVLPGSTAVAPFPPGCGNVIAHI